MLSITRWSFTSQAPPCHPHGHGRGAVGLSGVLGLLIVGVMTPASAATPELPSVQSRETRIALLSIFDQLGVGVNPADGATRSRANRRHPDVGFISSDPICLSCVMTVLAPPAVSPPAPRPSVPSPTVSSRPILPSPAPKPVLPLPVAPKPSLSKPVGSKPAAPKPPAPKPVTILQSRLPAVLSPPPVTITNPLEPPQAVVLITIPPLTIPTEILPDPSASVVPSAQILKQTPGPLPILGAGMALAASRRLRGRIKAARCREMR